MLHVENFFNRLIFCCKNFVIVTIFANGFYLSSDAFSQCHQTGGMPIDEVKILNHINLGQLGLKKAKINFSECQATCSPTHAISGNKLPSSWTECVRDTAGIFVQLNETSITTDCQWNWASMPYSRHVNNIILSLKKLKNTNKLVLTCKGSWG